MESRSDQPRRIDAYRLDEKIGEGGMGEIFRAWDESLDRSVALKLISSQRLDNPQARQRFRREAKLAAGLSHPAIVQIHRLLETTEAEDAGPLDCLVMELVEGRTLRQLMVRGRLSLTQLLPIWRQIAEGLAYAHAKGVIHRDLKIDNVMVTPLGHAKILDFGLAKRISGPATSLTQEGGLLGTLYAMAPEQARGKAVDARSDLFSLGVLFYETLFAARPFDGGDAHELWLNVMLNPHVSAREREPAVPAELAALIDRLLEKDPAARPQSAAEVLEVLARLDPAASLAAPAPGDPEIATRQDAHSPDLVTRVLPRTTRALPAAALPAAPASRLARLRLVLVCAAALLLLGLPPGLGGGATELAILADVEGLPPEGRALAGLLAERLIAAADLPPVLPPTWTFDPPVPAAGSLGGAAIVRIEQGAAGPRLQLSGRQAERTVELGAGGLAANLELAAGALRRYLGRPPEPEALKAELRLLLPADPVAALHYGEARAWLHLRRADRARILLREGEPPDFSPWRLARAESAWQWGDRGEMSQLLGTVDFEVYPRGLRRRYRAVAFEMDENFDSAIAIYRGLTPEVASDLGLLSRAILLAGREDRSLETRIGHARRLAGATRVAAWIAYREMGSLLLREQYDRALQIGLAALAQAEASGGRGLQAGLHFALASALVGLERHRDAIGHVEQAHRLFELPRDKAQCLDLKTVSRIHLQQPQEAIADLPKLEELYRSFGDLASASGVKANLATVLSQEGFWDQAEDLFLEAMAEQQAGGAAAEDALGQTLISFGAALLEIGQPAAAADQYLQAIAIFRRLERPDLLITALRNQSELEALRGEPMAAWRYFEEALEVTRRLGIPELAADGLVQLAETELGYGEIARAERHLAEARSLAGGEPGLRLELAAGLLELKKENFSRADELARAIAAEAAAQGGEIQFRARLLAARILLSRAKAGPADHQTALDILRATLETAVGSNNELHLAQAQILECVANAKLGQASARQRLARLEKDLAAKGFHFYAREAAEWLSELAAQ